MYKVRVFINNKGIRRYGVTRNGKIIFVGRSRDEAVAHKRMCMTIDIRASIYP